MELPEKPSDSDCCGSGCTPCVFDVYEELLSKWKVSTIKTSSYTAACSSEKLRIRTDLLSVLKYKPYKLVDIDSITENTNIYTFIPLAVEAQQSKRDDDDFVNEIEGVLPYEPGQHFVMINSKPDDNDNDNEIEKVKLSRSYTPISLARDEFNCRVKFLIKLYENGAMSRCISQLNINHVMYMRGAFGDFHHRPNSSYIFVCAGTGIAPVYAVIKSILRDETDDTIMRLIFACRTMDEIYFRDEIRRFNEYWNFTSRIYVSGQLSGLQASPSPASSSSSSRVKHDENIQFERICKEIIFNEVTSWLSSLSNGNCYKVLICGSSSFNDDISSYVEQSGISKDNLFVF